MIDWLDRPGGLARDRREPAATLESGGPRAALLGEALCGPDAAVAIGAAGAGGGTCCQSRDYTLASTSLESAVWSRMYTPIRRVRITRFGKAGHRHRPILAE